MKPNEYTLSYLPLFEQDLTNTKRYIRDTLGNKQAADKLVDNVEKAIFNKLKMPLSFEPYSSAVKRKYPYYRIYIGNYVVFYVVINKIMEIRRLIYGKRNFDELLPKD